MGRHEAKGEPATDGPAPGEGRTGEVEAKDGSKEGRCLNCGSEILGTYCHRCGQKAHVHRSLSAFGHDLLHGALHFEGQIWRTLPLLLWRPGELTRRYIEGERAKFVSPIALFLFIVFLMFAVMGLTGMLKPAAAGGLQAEAARELAEVQDELARLEAERGAAVRSGQATGMIDARISEARAEVSTLSAVLPGQVDQKGVDASEDVPSWLKGFVGRASANPELLFHKIKTNAYKFSWALIPISVPYVWLLFPFSRRFRAYDHMVFVTYSLAFMMLLLIVGSTAAMAWPTVANLLFIVPPFHMYRQLRGTYQLGRWGALWRTVMLIGFAFAAIGMFFALIVGAGEV